MKTIKILTIFFILVFGLTACVSNMENSSYSSTNNSSYKPESKEVVMSEKWYLIKLNNNAYQGPRITLEMSSDNRASGFSGCNRYFGTVDRLGSNQIKVGRIGSTRKMCPDQDVNQYERDYLNVLENVTRFNKSNNRLELEGSAGSLIYYKKSAR